MTCYLTTALVNRSTGSTCTRERWEAPQSVRGLHRMKEMDIQASPANRMTRAVLSILVMFVCLAHTRETLDDFKMVIEDVELYINSLKEEDFEMVANSFIDQYMRITDNVFNNLQFIGPEFAVAKKLFEALMEIIPELKAKWLKSPEDYKLFWEYIQKAIDGLKVLHETMVIKD
ncbi:unnamed protein product [Boreogadus saida]